MITHPVALYLGFTGFTVPFAFAIAALVVGRTGEEWITITRRWTIVAWYFLSLGPADRRLVELSRARLGRLLGLGSGGERRVHALAHRHRVPALGDDPGAAAHAEALEPHPRSSSPSASPSSAPSSRARGSSAPSTPSPRARSASSSSPSWRWSCWAPSRCSPGAMERLRAQGELDSILSRESAFLLNNLSWSPPPSPCSSAPSSRSCRRRCAATKVSVGAPFFNLVNIPIFLGPPLPHGRGPAHRLAARLVRRTSAATSSRRCSRASPPRPCCRALGLGNALVLALHGRWSSSSPAPWRWTSRAPPGPAGAAATAGPRPPGASCAARTGATAASSCTWACSSSPSGWRARRPGPVQTETTLNRGEHVELAGYRVRFDGLPASEESNHFKVTGHLHGRATGARPVTAPIPAKKFYPQEQTPIAYVDYRLGLIEDVYLVLGRFRPRRLARHRQAPGQPHGLLALDRRARADPRHRARHPARGRRREPA